MQQLVANQAAQSDGARAGRERQMQKSQLDDEAALWKKTGERGKKGTLKKARSRK